MSSKSKVNVLFVTNGLGVGGAEKLLVNIVNQIDPDKIQPTIVSLKADLTLMPEIISDRVVLYSAYRSWRYDLSPARRIRELIIKKEIDIIAPFSMFGFFFSRLATSGWKKPPQTNIYIHSSVPTTLKWFLQDWAYARLLRDDDRIISVCKAQAAYWSSAYGIPLEKFKTVYTGVDTARFDFSLSELRERDIRKEYGISAEAFVILQVANFQEYKHHDDAFEALIQIIGKLSKPVYLILVGSGSDRRASLLRQMAQDLGIMQHVIFCGHQPDVRPFIKAADVFTLTSSTETFSIAALEAMAMGVPCVLTDIGGAREMIMAGKNGFLVEAGNPTDIAAGWLKVFEHGELFDKTQIREIIVERFSLEKLITNFENMFLKKDDGCGC
jgi:glycosyltransferase involved in cell wall biosynthesis